MRNVDLQIGEAGCLEVRGKAVGETYWPTARPRIEGGLFSRRATWPRSSTARFNFVAGSPTRSMWPAGKYPLPPSKPVLLEHGRIAQCLAFGVPSADTDRAEVIVACIVAKSPVTGEELKQFLLRKIPAWQIPRQWWFVESLVTNRLGKISRADWRRRYLEKARCPEKAQA